MLFQVNDFYQSWKNNCLIEKKFFYLNQFGIYLILTINNNFIFQVKNQPFSTLLIYCKYVYKFTYNLLYIQVHYIFILLNPPKTNTYTRKILRKKISYRRNLQKDRNPRNLNRKSKKTVKNWDLPTWNKRKRE